jgi:hypothetical protein
MECFILSILEGLSLIYLCNYNYQGNEEVLLIIKMVLFQEQDAEGPQNNS